MMNGIGMTGCRGVELVLVKTAVHRRLFLRTGLRHEPPGRRENPGMMMRAPQLREPTTKRAGKSRNIDATEWHPTLKVLVAYDCFSSMK